MRPRARRHATARRRGNSKCAAPGWPRPIQRTRRGAPLDRRWVVTHRRVACIDEDGYVKLRGSHQRPDQSRAARMDQFGDLETAVDGPPGWREAAVIGVPHRNGRKDHWPLWCSRMAGAPSLGTARVPCRPPRQMAAPGAIVFADEIPRTSVGKFKKSALRERYANGRGSRPANLQVTIPFLQFPETRKFTM